MSHRALLIGVTRHLNGNDSLEGADANTRLMADLLVSYYGADRNRDLRIRVQPHETTREAIFADLKGWLLADLKPGAVRVLAVSAHGVACVQQDGKTNDFFSTADNPGKGGGVFQSEIDAAIGPVSDQCRVYCLFDSCRPKFTPPEEFARTLSQAAERAGLHHLMDASFLRFKFMRGLTDPPVYYEPGPATPAIVDDARPWVVLKACAVSQSAAYYGQTGGKFTRSICDFLGTAACTPPAETIERLCKQYLKEGQNPEVRGPMDWLRDRTIFS